VGWASLAVLAIGWVLWMTLRPDRTANTINLIPLREHMQAVWCLRHSCPGAGRAARFLFVDVLGNIAVFVPIGFSLSGALGRLPVRRRLFTATSIGVLLSVMIELVQLAIPSRATDVDDVLFNGLGAAAGAAVMLLMQHWLKTNRE
jgi:glycopeptide antibiotics resistance protein